MGESPAYPPSARGGGPRAGESPSADRARPGGVGADRIGGMEITGVRAQLLDVNCWLAAAGDGGPGSPCILVDAGYDCAPGVRRLLEEREWELAAVILTHGHPDHILGLPGVLDIADAPVILAEADVYRLADPAGTASAQFASMLAPITAGWSAPQTRPLSADGEEIAGLSITATAAPGHTEGSTLYHVSDSEQTVMFSGDVLFAGSIGRTDLAGGDPEAMQRSLEMIRRLDDVPVLPGHGPATQLSHELTANPFL